MSNDQSSIPDTDPAPPAQAGDQALSESEARLVAELGEVAASEYGQRAAGVMHEIAERAGEDEQKRGIELFRKVADYERRLDEAVAQRGPLVCWPCAKMGQMTEPTAIMQTADHGPRPFCARCRSVAAQMLGECLDVATCVECGIQGVRVLTSHDRGLCSAHEPREGAEQRMARASAGVIGVMEDHALTMAEEIAVCCARIGDVARAAGESFDTVQEVLRQSYEAAAKG